MVLCSCFFFNDTATTEIYTLSLHDALPISILGLQPGDLGDSVAGDQAGVPVDRAGRRREHHLRHVPPAAGEPDQIGRAHRLTPHTPTKPMSVSCLKKKKIYITKNKHYSQVR